MNPSGTGLRSLRSKITDQDDACRRMSNGGPRVRPFVPAPPRLIPCRACPSPLSGGVACRSVYADETMHAAWMLALWLGAGDKPPMVSTARVRAAHGAERVLADAARSGTVRGLLDRLAASDLIVYIEMAGTPDVPTARTKLVAATASVRFVRIAISAGQPWSEWASLLAHELQHAVEIADHTDVRDDGGLRRLYASIGHQHGTDSYETDAAVGVERLVRAELRHGNIDRDGSLRSRIPDP